MLDSMIVGNTRAQILMRDQFDYSKRPRPAGSGSHPIRGRAASTMRGLAALLADSADYLDRDDMPSSVRKQRSADG